MAFNIRSGDSHALDGTIQLLGVETPPDVAVGGEASSDLDDSSASIPPGGAASGTTAVSARPARLFRMGFVTSTPGINREKGNNTKGSSL